MIYIERTGLFPPESLNYFYIKLFLIVRFVILPLFFQIFHFATLLNDGVTIKMPYGVDVLHQPALFYINPIFSCWVC